MKIIYFFKNKKRLIYLQIENRIASIIEFFGFIHRDRWYLSGEESRLILNDPLINKKYRNGYSNAIFSTRSGEIIIGRNVIFGHECQILTARHNHLHSNPLQMKEIITSGFDIKICDGVWLTSRVIVTGGVTIGENSTILPGSVVTKDIPPNSIAGGMPAKVINTKNFID